MSILDVTPAEYHRIEAFSASRAKRIIEESPLHAITYDDTPSTDDQDFGTLCHYLITGKGNEPVVVDANDWRTKAAREARSDARANRIVAVLPRTMERAKKAADSARLALARHSKATNLVPAAFSGRSECVMTWTERTPWGEVTCKGMMDHVWIDERVILDLKFTSGKLSNSAIERTAEEFGHAIQDTAYRRGLEANIDGADGHVRFYFLMVETSQPFDSRLVECDGTMREVGLRRWTKALHRWAECTRNNEWPGRSAELYRMTTPQWALSRLEEE